MLIVVLLLHIVNFLFSFFFSTTQKWETLGLECTHGTLLQWVLCSLVFKMYSYLSQTQHHRLATGWYFTDTCPHTYAVDDTLTLWVTWLFSHSDVDALWEVINVVRFSMLQMSWAVRHTVRPCLEAEVFSCSKWPYPRQPPASLQQFPV